VNNPIRSVDANIAAGPAPQLLPAFRRKEVRRGLTRTHDYQIISDTAPAIESRLATQAAEGWRPILMSTATVNTALQVFLVLEKPIPTPYTN
jgi:hypothetical protein